MMTTNGRRPTPCGHDQPKYRMTIEDSAPYRAPLEHAQLRKYVDEFLSLTKENKDLVERDRRYFDGDQISDVARAELAKRGQPAIFTNKIGPAINGLLGIIDAAESDPECFPRTYRSQDAADVATKTLRYVADRGGYKVTRKKCSDNYLIQGVTAAIVEWTGKHVTTTRIRWDEFIYDPLSVEHEFTDAKYLGVAKMMEVDEVLALFPAYGDLGMPEGDFTGFEETQDSKRLWWSTLDRKQVRVVDLYYVAGGEWHRMVLVESGELYAGPSEYVDDDGVSICPITATTYEINQGGERYGAIRNMIPLQDEVNARRSRLLHLVNHRQVRVVDPIAASTDKNIARREASSATGVIPLGYEVVHAPDLAQGQMLILQKTEADLDRMAPTPAVLGRVASSSESGRARQMLQQAGYTELARGFGRFEDFEKQVYRRMWWAARQYLDQPTLIRIVDDPRAPDFVTLNEPEMAEQMMPVENPETGGPLIDPYTGEPVLRPEMVQVGVKNRLAELDMDIILSMVPDQVSLEQEVFEKIMDLAGSTGISPFDPQFLAMLEIAPLPDKRGVIERIQRLAQKASEQQAEAAQQQQQMAEAAAGADLAVKQSKAQKDQAQAMKSAMDARKIEQELRGIMPVSPPPIPDQFGGQYFPQ